MVNSRQWSVTLLLLLLVWTALVLLLEPAGSSMRAVWDSSETYAHGYIIFPIFLWLVWRQRHVIATTPIKADVWALLPALAIACIWLAGRVVGAQVVEHYALVSLMIIAFWALLGRAMVLVLLFPLFYLLLMVPAGDSLIEPMIHFTADFTVGMVRLMGIPVLQEGTFFVLPSGEWSVVEACSGIRYFLSSIVLGWLFAYLTYRTWWKRLAFGFAAVVVPIFANGFRATIIVLLGHYSGMTVAVGVDHLIYGWVWFGIVMLLMFWIGSIWREDEESASHAAPALVLGLTPTPPRPAWAIAAVLIGLVALFPWYDRHLSAAPPVASPLVKWQPAANWQPLNSVLTDWQPRWIGMDDQLKQTLQQGDDQVMLFIGWYGAQRQDAELINSQNILVTEKDPTWRNLYESGRSIPLANGTLDVRQAQLDAPGQDQRLLVWHWRFIDGEADSNIFRGKLRLAISKLQDRGNAAAGVLIAAPYKEKPEEAEAALKAFLRDNLAPLNQLLGSTKP